MTTLTNIPAKAGTTCVDGMDVFSCCAIDEASVASSLIDLFDLLLDAQLMLVALQAGDPAGRTPMKAKLRRLLISHNATRSWQ